MPHCDIIWNAAHELMRYIDERTANLCALYHRYSCQQSANNGSDISGFRRTICTTGTDTCDTCGAVGSSADIDGNCGSNTEQILQRDAFPYLVKLRY